MVKNDQVLTGNHHLKEISAPSSPEMVGAVVLLREDGAALLQHRDDKPGLRHAGMWVPPGGHCDPGEAIEDCARREMLEETGYVCDELNWLITIEDNYAEGWPSYPLTVFWAKYDGVQAVTCMEGQALQFVEHHLADSYLELPYLKTIWDMAITAMSKT